MSEMKKILVTLLMISLLVSLAACGTNDTPNTENNTPSTSESTPSQTDEPTKATEEAQGNSGIDLMYTFKDPSKPVAFDYPNMKSIEEGTSQVFKNSKFLIVYCRDTKQATLNNVVQELSEKFGTATRTHLEGTFDSFSVTKTENKTINQTDVLLVEGVVVSKYDDGTSIQLPMRGYTFAKGDVVCELIAVLNEESNTTNQEEMNKTIDAIIATLRDDR